MRRPSRIQSKRISNTPSRSGPRNVFGRMITLSSGDARTSSSHAIFDSPYAPDAVRAESSRQRMHLRHAVHRGRRDVDDAPTPALARGREQRGGPVDVHGHDLAPRAADRQRRGGVHEHVGAVAELARARRVAHVAADLGRRRARPGRRSARRRACARRGPEPRGAARGAGRGSLHLRRSRTNGYRRDRNAPARLAAPVAAAASSRRAPRRRAAPPFRSSPRRQAARELARRAGGRARRAAAPPCGAARPTRARPRRARA